MFKLLPIRKKAVFPVLHSFSFFSPFPSLPPSFSPFLFHCSTHSLTLSFFLTSFKHSMKGLFVICVYMCKEVNYVNNKLSTNFFLYGQFFLCLLRNSFLHQVMKIVFYVIFIILHFTFRSIVLLGLVFMFSEDESQDSFFYIHI